MKRPMGSAQLFSLLRGPNHVMGSVGNRIENITGNMAVALLSLHQLDLRTLSAVYSQYSTHSLGLLSFLRVRKEKSQPSISSGFFKRNPAALRNPVTVVGFEPCRSLSQPSGVLPTIASTPSYGDAFNS